MDLYSQVCLRLKKWEFSTSWPNKPAELLAFVHEEILKWLPYVAAFNNLYRARTDLEDSGFRFRNDLHFDWCCTHQLQLVKRLREWVYKMPQLNSTYYGTYSSKSNRLETLFELNIATLTTRFSLDVVKEDTHLSVLKNFAYWLGNPLATVQKREVKSKTAYVLCIPKEAISYGL